MRSSVITAELVDLTDASKRITEDAGAVLERVRDVATKVKSSKLDTAVEKAQRRCPPRPVSLSCYPGKSREFLRKRVFQPP